jgi:hypothetical protein
MFMATVAITIDSCCARINPKIPLREISGPGLRFQSPRLRRAPLPRGLRTNRVPAKETARSRGPFLVAWRRSIAIS